MVSIPFSDPPRPGAPLSDIDHLTNYLIFQIPLIATIVTYSILQQVKRYKYPIFNSDTPRLETIPVMSDPERDDTVKTMWHLKAGTRLQVVTSKEYLIRQAFGSTNEYYYTLSENDECPFVLFGLRFLYRGTRSPKTIELYNYASTAPTFKTYQPEIGLLVLTAQTAKDLNDLLFNQLMKPNNP